MTKGEGREWREGKGEGEGREWGVVVKVGVAMTSGGTAWNPAPLGEGDMLGGKDEYRMAIVRVVVTISQCVFVANSGGGQLWIPAPCFRRDMLRRNDERGRAGMARGEGQGWRFEDCARIFAISLLSANCEIVLWWGFVDRGGWL